METILFQLFKYFSTGSSFFLEAISSRGNKSFNTNNFEPCAFINFEPCAFIQSFFLLLESITEIRCKPVPFQFLTVEAFFTASGNGFSIECCSFRRVKTDSYSSVLLFRANFVSAETIVFIYYAFIYITAGESSFSAY